MIDLLEEYPDLLNQLRSDLKDVVEDIPYERDNIEYKTLWIKEELKRLIKWNIRENLPKDSGSDQKQLVEDMALQFVDNNVGTDIAREIISD